MGESNSQLDLNKHLLVRPQHLHQESQYKCQLCQMALEYCPSQMCRVLDSKVQKLLTIGAENLDLLGRLEIFTLLVVLTPAFWRK